MGGEGDADGIADLVKIALLVIGIIIVVLIILLSQNN